MKRISLPIFILIVMITLTSPGRARAEEGLASPSSDIKPPKIDIVSPARNSEVDTGMPWIEVLTEDTGSGVDSQTIRLILDRVDVTVRAIIENTDVTGQAPDKPWRIRYQPELALNDGRHAVEFIVRDRAGNLATLKWSFQVNANAEGGTQIGGTNTLEASIKPVEKVDDFLELYGKFQWADSSIRFELKGNATDYPEFDPDYTWNGVNFNLDRYNLGWYGRDTMLQVGYVGVPLDYSLLQVGSEIKGEVFSGIHRKSDGQFDWSVFSGEVASSYGLGISVYKMSGVNGGWERDSGTGFKTFYLQLDDGDTYDFWGLQGCGNLLGFGMFRIEAIHGVAPDGGSGNRLSLKLDLPVGNVPLGLDFNLYQPDYPLPGISPTLSSERSGLKSLELYGEIPLGRRSRLSLDMTAARDNLDDRLSYTENYQNISAKFRSDPSDMFSYCVSYQGDLQESEGFPVNVVQNRTNFFGVEINQKFSDSKLTAAASREEVKHDEVGLDSSESSRLYAAWTKPMSKINWTPSVQWTENSWTNGETSETLDVRLTLDTLFEQNIAQSKLGLFHRIVNERSEGGLWTRTVTEGLELSLNFKPGPYSMVSLTLNYSLWDKSELIRTEGDSNLIQFTWKRQF